MPSAPDATYFGSDYPRTRISNAERTERDAGALRSEKLRAARVAVEVVDQHAAWHEQTLRQLLREKADTRARLGLRGLLAELTDAQGLGWSELARLVGVSVPAVRKWRHGGSITYARLESLARLVAFLDLLHQEGVADPAAWLSLPVEGGDGRPVAKAEIYLAGGAVDLLLYVKGYLNYNDLLERAPSVERPQPSKNQLVVAGDGRLSIVPTKNCN